MKTKERGLKMKRRYGGKEVGGTVEEWRGDAEDGTEDKQEEM